MAPSAEARARLDNVGFLSQNDLGEGPVFLCHVRAWQALGEHFGSSLSQTGREPFWFSVYWDSSMFGAGTGAYVVHTKARILYHAALLDFQAFAAGLAARGERGQAMQLWRSVVVVVHFLCVGVLARGGSSRLTGCGRAALDPGVGRAVCSLPRGSPPRGSPVSSPPCLRASSISPLQPLRGVAVLRWHVVIAVPAR